MTANIRGSRGRGLRGTAKTSRPQGPRSSVKNFNFLFAVLAVSRSSRYREDRETAKDFQYFLFGLAVFAVPRSTAFAGSGTDRQTFWSVGCRNIGLSVGGKLV